jgi:adenosylhomocysteine nucleosidase/adenosylhomocysteine/aminodeoxyfutalosine nucleosidase
MIGISIAQSDEWEVTLKYFKQDIDNCTIFPFGMYFKKELNGKEVLFYRCNVRKVCSSASAQYMIDHFNLNKIIVIGTCAGIDKRYNQYDIVLPNKAVQYDCTVKENEPLIKERFIVKIDLSSYDFEYNTGIIGTADKPVVMWKDYLELLNNNITIADTEAAAIAYVCKMNKIDCLIIKGISDFPTNEAETSVQISNEEQYNIYIKNIPVVINKILDTYLLKVINLK